MLRALILVCVAASLAGCELIADFDRSKIVVDAGPSAGDGDGDGDGDAGLGPAPDAAEPDDDGGL